MYAAQSIYLSDSILFVIYLSDSIFICNEKNKL